MKRKEGNLYIVTALLILALIALSACASAAKLLENAEDSWTAGAYSESISKALSSYEKAVDKNKDQSEIDGAKNFLIKKFPLANENLVKEAEKQLEGRDSDKAMAWKTFQELVAMNTRVGNSIASSFLDTVDYSEQLQKAKEVAAQIKYVKVLELIGEDKRSSYIDAAGVIGEINSIVPDYRDVRSLLEICYESGTLVVAFSKRSIYFDVDSQDFSNKLEFSDKLDAVLRDYIIKNDYPDFLDFITAANVKDAEELGAVLFIEYQGDVWISSEISNTYLNNGSIVWKRSYGGTPAVLATRIRDTRNEFSSVTLNLEQSISVEFFPVKYNTDTLTQDMYSQQFNNSAWMASQLNEAEYVMGDNKGSASMIIWAEMQYGGVVDFLDSAVVNGSEGTQDLPIDSAVYNDTEDFINDTLPGFVEFSDMNIEDRIVNEIFGGFLQSSGVRELLSKLED